MPDRLRFGIIGCGVIGPTHAEAIAAHAAAHLAAVADPDVERAEKLARQYHATPYADLHAMLHEERLDVACVCTPSGYHGEHAIAVMQAGVHVVVEKPMAVRTTAISF